jgi:hypothetical protein
LKKERKTFGARKVTVVVALCCAAGALLFATAIAIDVGGSSNSSGGSRSSGGGGSDSSGGGGSDSPGGGGPNSPSGGNLALVSTQERVSAHEALPCTGIKQPANFETFTAGPSVAGVPLNTVRRRCGDSTPADEPPANFVNYIYGHCDSSGSDTGCAPPLEIQTWPACQRSLGDYSYEGKPMPYRQLPSIDGAEVVEIEFMFEPRIEVYTKSSTIVIFAENPDLAKAAIAQLGSQEIGQPPATQAEELKDGEPGQGLGPPSDNAIEGELSCQS